MVSQACLAAGLQASPRSSFDFMLDMNSQLFLFFCSESAPAADHIHMLLLSLTVLVSQLPACSLRLHES